MADGQGEDGRFVEGNEIGKDGRPSSYSPDMIELARKVAQLGATDVDIADVLGISDRQLRRWKNQHEEFAEALEVGKSGPDSKVVRSLYQQAIGYSYTTQQAIKVKIQEKPGTFREEVVVVDVEVHVPGAAVPAIFWLKNRRKDEWRDKVDHEHGGRDGAPIETNLNLTGLNDDQLRVLASIPISGK